MDFGFSSARVVGCGHAEHTGTVGTYGCMPTGIQKSACSHQINLCSCDYVEIPVRNLISAIVRSAGISQELIIILLLYF